MLPILTLAIQRAREEWHDESIHLRDKGLLQVPNGTSLTCVYLCLGIGCGTVSGIGHADCESDREGPT